MELIEETRRLDGTLAGRTYSRNDGTGYWEEYDEEEILINTVEVFNLPIKELEVATVALTPEEISVKMREAFDSVATGTLTVSKLKQAILAAIDSIGMS